MKSSFSGKLSRRCSCKKLKRPIVKAHRCASPWIMQSHKIRHRLIKDSNAPLCKAINPSTKRNIKRGWTFMEHVAFSVRCWWSIHQRDGFKSTFVSFTWKLISQSVTRTFFFSLLHKFTSRIFSWYAKSTRVLTVTSEAILWVLQNTSVCFLSFRIKIARLQQNEIRFYAQTPTNWLAANTRASNNVVICFYCLSFAPQHEIKFKLARMNAKWNEQKKNHT